MTLARTFPATDNRDIPRLLLQSDLFSFALTDGHNGGILPLLGYFARDPHCRK